MTDKTGRLKETREGLQEEIDRRIDTLLREIKSERKIALEGRMAERDHAEQLHHQLQVRLDGMDKATEVLNEIVTRVPTDVQQAVANLRDVMDERFDSIDTQFAERDIRSEREARDNKVAVDAAFAAQKDSATQTDAANAKAIEKSERATAETISKLNGLFEASNKSLSEKIESSTKGLTDKIDDLKARTTAMEQRAVGAMSERGDKRQGTSANMAAWTIGLTVVWLLISVISIALATHGFK